MPAMEQQIKFALKYRMSKEGIEALCRTRKPKMAEVEIFRTANVLFGAETSNSLIGKKCTIKQLGQFLTEQMIRKEFEENLLIKRLAEEADTARRQARELEEKFEETKESLKGMLEEARQETVQRDIEIMVKEKTEPLMPPSGKKTERSGNWNSSCRQCGRKNNGAGRTPGRGWRELKGSSNASGKRTYSWRRKSSGGGRKESHGKGTGASEEPA